MPSGPSLGPGVGVPLAGCSWQGSGGSGARTAGSVAGHDGRRRPVAFHARRLGRLPAPVQLPAAASLPGGGVLVVGGLSAADTSLPTIVALHGGRARAAGALPAALHDAAAARIGGSVYFFGGGSTGSSAQILRLGTGQLAALAATLSAPASDIGAASIGGTAYVVGGHTGPRALGSIVGLRPGSAARVAGTLPVPGRYPAVAADGGQVLVAAGTVADTLPVSCSASLPMAVCGGSRISPSRSRTARPPPSVAMCTSSAAAARRSVRRLGESSRSTRGPGSRSLLGGCPTPSPMPRRSPRTAGSSCSAGGMHPARRATRSSLWSRAGEIPRRRGPHGPSGPGGLQRRGPEDAHRVRLRQDPNCPRSRGSGQPARRASRRVRRGPSRPTESGGAALAG